jgi:hypothetical protein
VVVHHRRSKRHNSYSSPTIFSAPLVLWLPEGEELGEEGVEERKSAASSASYQTEYLVKEEAQVSGRWALGAVPVRAARRPGVLEVLLRQAAACSA